MSSSVAVWASRTVRSEGCDHCESRQSSRFLEEGVGARQKRKYEGGSPKGAALGEGESVECAASMYSVQRNPVSGIPAKMTLSMNPL